MEQVFSYIIGLGAAVMMPIIFTILGVCIGIKFSKALKSGLLVGVGFVGLSVVTALLTSSLGPALSKVVEIYGLQLKVFDMGWPAAGVLTLAGCSNSSSSTAASGTAASVAPAASDQLSSIQSSGKLIVALEGAWQPWSFHDESDTLVGYDVEVSRAIAEKLGVEPEYVESDWDSLFAGLDAGRYDIVCNGVEVTDERAKTYDFTEPYGYIHTALAVRKDNEDITSFEDLKGKTTANSLASTYMELAESYGATVQGIDTLEETIQLLTAGRIDATLNADVSFYDYLNVHPDADFKLVAQTEDASHVGIPLRKGDASATLLEAINTAIEELRADGTLKELGEKYFGQDISAEN